MTKNKLLLFGILLLAVTLIGFGLFSSNRSDDDSSNVIPQSPITNTPETTALPIVSEDKSIEDFDSLLDMLEANGIELLRSKGQTLGGRFSVQGSGAILVEGESQQRFQALHGLEYATLNEANTDASRILADGMFQDVPMHTTSPGTPYFYKKDNLIVIFIDHDTFISGSNVTNLLESVLGPPFVIGFSVGRDGSFTVSSDLILTRDYNFRDNGFIIGADNITIDLNGHSITGSGIADGILLEGRKGVTIRNGTISFTNAIRLSDSDSNLILNNQLQGGLIIAGNNNKVQNNKGIVVVRDSGYVDSVGEFFIEVQGDENEIFENLVRWTRLFATTVHINGTQNTITGNNIGEFRIGGIIEGSTGARITGLGNVFSDNTVRGSQTGLILDGANQSIVSGNGIGRGGMLVTNSYDNRISNNGIFTNGIGLTILSGSRNEVSANNIVGRPGVIIRADDNELSGNNVTYHIPGGRTSFSFAHFVYSREEARTIDISSNGNLVMGNTITGTLVMTGERNIIVLNNFISPHSQFHARDEGMNNIWHRNGNGNYWAGIFDNPYRIPGKAQSFDRFPVRTPY